MKNTIRNRFGMIAHADDCPPGVPRVRLCERTVRDCRVWWIDTEFPDIALVTGRTAREADAAAKRGLVDFRFTGYGSHRLPFVAAKVAAP